MSSVFASLLRHPWSKPLAAVVDVVLVGLILYSLTRFLWLILDWNAPLPSVASDAGSDLAQSPPPPSLANWHLFGRGSMPVDRRALSNAPETQLPIDLRGVLAGTDPKRGLAFIADASGERSFRVGQEVAPGVILDAVYPDRVALSRNGAIEVLKLRTPAVSGTNSAAPHRSMTDGSDSVPESPAIAAIVPTDRAVFGRVEAPNVPLQGVDMTRVKQQLGVDPVVLANQITPLPVMEHGKFVGVRLHGGQHADVLARLGLRPEDVVTGINGVPITDPSRIAAAVAALSEASRIEVQIRRDGQMQTLTVDLPR